MSQHHFPLSYLQRGGADSRHSRRDTHSVKVWLSGRTASGSVESGKCLWEVGRHMLGGRRCKSINQQTMIHPITIDKAQSNRWRVSSQIFCLEKILKFAKLWNLTLYNVPSNLGWFIPYWNPHIKCCCRSPRISLWKSQGTFKSLLHPPDSPKDLRDIEASGKRSRIKCFLSSVVWWQHKQERSCVGSISWLYACSTGWQLDLKSYSVALHLHH